MLVLVLSVFFLMIRRPPRSTRTDTLFPYTTLFRSNTLDEPLYASWQKGEIAHLTSDYAGKPIPDHFGSIEQAVQEARKAQPELKPAFVSYAGTGYSGDHNYGVFMKGNTSLLERNFQQVLRSDELRVGEEVVSTYKLRW